MDETIRALTDLASIDLELRDENPKRDDTKRLEERRAVLRRQLSGLLLATYDALARAGRHPPIVETRGGYCGGCHIRLPQQFENQLRGEKNLFTCPHCRRFLHARSGSESERSIAQGHGGKGDGD